ncbi:hypothetical protein AB0I60_05915 [Actinosynnema sp. NPDC050436]|uniref:hypothetical protein n=1 Tax=Actinosynnema sp. NPDC050436 TaxID=3155659 RepID=UPI0033C7CD71
MTRPHRPRPASSPSRRPGAARPRPTPPLRPEPAAPRPWLDLPLRVASLVVAAANLAADHVLPWLRHHD